MQRSCALIFDLDGTLVDSLGDIANALNAALTDLGRAPARIEDIRGWVGGGLPALCTRAAPDADEKSLEYLVERALTHYSAHCVVHTRPFPNILQMLSLLKSRGAPMAVLSNKPHALTREVIDRLAMADFFQVVLGYQSEKEKKPSPIVALQIAKQLHSSVGSTLMVGDSAIDLQTARNAGMVSIAVTWGFRNREELAAAGPDFLVTDPLEIPDIAARRSQSL